MEKRALVPDWESGSWSCMLQQDQIKESLTGVCVFEESGLKKELGEERLGNRYTHMLAIERQASAAAGSRWISGSGIRKAGRTPDSIPPSSFPPLIRHDFSIFFSPSAAAAASPSPISPHQILVHPDPLDETTAAATASERRRKRSNSSKSLP